MATQNMATCMGMFPGHLNLMTSLAQRVPLTRQAQTYSYGSVSDLKCILFTRTTPKTGIELEIFMVVYCVE